MTKIAEIKPHKRVPEAAREELDRFLALLSDDRTIGFSAIIHMRDGEYSVFGSKSENRHERVGQLMELVQEYLMVPTARD